MADVNLPGELVEERRKHTGDFFDRDNSFLLLVDGEPATLHCTAMLLKRFHYMVVKANSARQALEVTATSLPSLIIAANHLPDMSGFELLDRVKNRPVAPPAGAIILKEDTSPAQERDIHANRIRILNRPPAAEMLYEAVQAAVEKKPRKNIRIRTFLPVTLTGTPGKEAVREYGTMLSEGGLFLRTGRIVAMNRRFSMRLELEGRIIPTETVVVHCNRRAGAPYGEPGLGLHFEKIDPADQEVIRNFIRREITHGLNACFN